MICVSYVNHNFLSLSEILKEQNPELAELRLDLLKLSKDELKKILSLDYTFICTAKNSDCFELLKFSIDNGAKYVDIDIEMDEKNRDKLIHYARANGCKIILSYHDYKKTPVKAELQYVMDWCLELNPDVIKIACMVNENRDNVRLLSLLDTNSKIIVIGMGENGRVSRVLAPKLGAFCTYVSSEKGMESAPGQLSYLEMKKIMETLSIV